MFLLGVDEKIKGGSLSLHAYPGEDDVCRPHCNGNPANGTLIFEHFVRFSVAHGAKPLLASSLRPWPSTWCPPDAGSVSVIVKDCQGYCLRKYAYPFVWQPSSTLARLFPPVICFVQLA